MSDRVVSRFSCGAASAVATKIAIERHGDRTHIINAFIADEDADNRRFLVDCERWFGRAITVLRDEKYGASPAAGRFKDEQPFECGAVCEMPDAVSRRLGIE